MTKEQASEILTQEVIRQACKDLYALNKNHHKTKKQIEEQIYIENWLDDLGLWSLVCAIYDGKKPLTHDNDIKPLNLPSTNDTVIQRTVRTVNNPVRIFTKYKPISERSFI